MALKDKGLKILAQQNAVNTDILIDVLMMGWTWKLYILGTVTAVFPFLRHCGAPGKNVKLECGMGCPRKTDLGPASCFEGLAGEH